MYPWSKVLWYLCSQVIPWFYIAHHLVRITMRLKWSTVVFTCRLKRGKKAPFEVQMLLMAILITLPCSKVFVLKLATVAQNDYLKPKLSLYCHFALKRKRWPPFFICALYSLCLHKRCILRGKRIWIIGVVFFLDMNDANFWAVNKTRIGLLGSDRTGNSPYKFKVTLKVIACWLLYDCEGLG